jgi:hypothetical protein
MHSPIKGGKRTVVHRVMIHRQHVTVLSADFDWYAQCSAESSGIT